MQKDTFARVGILIAMVIAIGFGVVNQMAISTLAGAAGRVGTVFPDGLGVGTSTVTRYDLTVGNGGTALSGLIANSCNLIGTDSSQPATSTKAYDCAITGMTPSYKVFAQLASTTPVILAATGSGSGWLIVGSSASSTAGFVTVLLHNGSGTAAVPSATNVGSSTKVLGWRN